MDQVTPSRVIKTAVLITYIAMVVMNALANILPINDVSTGQVSDSYPNLFAPAGLTFSIWGVIYLLLACYSLYQLGIFNKDTNERKAELINTVGKLFALSSIANILWIFSWHYQMIPLSMLNMLIILACLIFINKRILKESLNPVEKVFVQLPFSVYFGWITVATIANATVLLVSLGWNGFGISEQAWTVVVLFIGVFIAILTILKHNDIPYGLVFIWAYSGIIIKHISAEGFAFQYPAVVYTAAFCISLLVMTLGYSAIRRSNRGKSRLL